MEQIDPQNPTADLLIECYSRGIFPMADPDMGIMDYYSPDPRAIIPLDAFHVPTNLAREVRKRRFEIRCDSAFEQVMRECATPRSEWNQSWMNERLMRPYLELFERGHAHSIEAWRGKKLVGGLYGVHIGGLFAGESMFSRPDLGGSNSSKVCLVHLVNWLRARGFTLLDVQFENPHLTQFGATLIPRTRYLAMLEPAVRTPAEWGEFKPLCSR